MSNKVKICVINTFLFIVLTTTYSCKVVEQHKINYKVLNNNIYEILRYNEQTKIYLQEEVLNLSSQLNNSNFFEKENFIYSYGSGGVLGVDSKKVMTLINTTDITAFRIPKEPIMTFKQKKLKANVEIINRDNPIKKNKVLTVLSNIYFFENGNNFFIIEGYNFDSLNSSGNLLFFKKVNGEWEFDFKIPLWIS